MIRKRGSAPRSPLAVAGRVGNRPGRRRNQVSKRGGEPMAKILESLQNTVIAGVVLTVIFAIILASI